MLCKVTAHKQALSGVTTRHGAGRAMGKWTWIFFFRDVLIAFLASCGRSPLPVACEQIHSDAGRQSGPTSASFQPTRLELTSPPTIHGAGPARPCNAWPDARAGAPRPSGRASSFPFRFRVHSVFPFRPRRRSPTRAIHVPLSNPFPPYNSSGPVQANDVWCTAHPFQKRASPVPYACTSRAAPPPPGVLDT